MIYSRTIQLIVIEMASMAVKYLIKAYEPRIAVYGASLHQQVFFTSKNTFFTLHIYITSHIILDYLQNNYLRIAYYLHAISLIETLKSYSEIVLAVFQNPRAMNDLLW